MSVTYVTGRYFVAHTHTNTQNTHVHTCTHTETGTQRQAHRTHTCTHMYTHVHTHRDSHAQRQTHGDRHTETGTQNTHMYRIKNFPALLLVKMVGYGFQNSIFVHTVIDATVGGAGGRAVVGWAGSSTGEQAA